MTVVLPTRTLTLSNATFKVLFEASSNNLSSCFWPENALTTRIPVRFSSIRRVSTPNFSCISNHIQRSFSRASEDRHPTNGTNDNARMVSSRSVFNISNVAPPINTINITRRTIPVLINILTPSKSSIPRVIRSPV